MVEPRLGVTRRWTTLSARLLATLAIALTVDACGEEDMMDPNGNGNGNGAASVAITPGTFGVLSGETVQLDATVLDDNGNPVSGATVTWSSNNTNVASVDMTSGLVTAGDAGMATITATSDGVSGTANGEVVASAAFDADVQPIFTGNCAFEGCHGGSMPQQGMDLEDGAAYTNIVNVASMELPSMDRIEPGDPAMSYLLHKLRGTQVDVGGMGDRMPQGGAPLDDGLINIIEAWTRAGAPEN